MSKSIALLLQAAIVLVGIAAVTFLFWEPHLEGRNARATTFEIYFKDPFLAFAYVGSIPFFLGLHRGFKLCEDYRKNGAFTQVTVKALRTIQWCALLLVGFVAVGELFILSSQGEDAAGGVFIGLVITFGSVVTAAVAAMFASSLRKRLDRIEGRPA